MKLYETNEIRNIALLGHIGSGKTTLSEAMLVISGTKEKMGNTLNGTTSSDYHKEEKEKHFSIRLSPLTMEYQGHKYNILDYPGYEDFKGDIYSSIDIIDGAVLVIDGSSGIELGTINSWKLHEDNNIPRIIFINKMNKGFINYKKLLEELKEKFGKKLAPLSIPIGDKGNFKGFINIVENKARIFNGINCEDSPIPKELIEEEEEIKNLLKEAVAEADDNLLEKFLDGQDFSDEELVNGLHLGITHNLIVPVILGAATDMIGVNTLFQMLYKYFPNSAEKNEGIKIAEDNEHFRNISLDENFSAKVFKTIFDPYVGKISFFKVFSGSIKKDTEVLNSNCNKKEKISNLYFFRGKEQIETDEIVSSDIGATTRLNYTKTGDTLCSINNEITYEALVLPKANLFYALETFSKNDDEKIIDSLQKLKDEDPSFEFYRNLEVKQLIIAAQGEKQLQILINRLNNEFDLKVKLIDARTNYKETLTKSIEVEGKYKKQSGGAGHYGHVFIKFEPSKEPFEFFEEIHGGSVPKQYFPAIEKGIIESMKKGVLGGFPVTNIKATLLDGSFHSVDSNDFDFKIAASFAYKKAMLDGESVILEPIVKVMVTVFDTYTKDIIGNLNKKRGKVLGIDSLNSEEKIITALVPQSEMFKYLLDLQSITHSTGAFEMEFEKYEKLPKELVNKVIKDYGISEN